MNQKYILFLIPTLTLAAGIQINPANPSATQGQSITITANGPVNFKLSGAGSISNTSGTNTTYTAPSSLVAGHVLNGCMVLPSDAVFNTKITNLPVSAGSANEIPYIANNGINVGFQWGTNVVTNQTPAVPQSFYYTPQMNGTPFPIPALVDMKREEGAFTSDGDNDHHLFIVNRNSCNFYETYQQNMAAPSCIGCTAQSGWAYSSTSYAQPTGGTTDAAGLPLGPLTLHLSELKAGVINHALRFTGCTGCVSPNSVWPATGSSGGEPGAPPMGSRFRLKASFDVSSFPPAAQAVLNALKQYGMFVADLGTTGQISASSDITEDSSILNQLLTINSANITASAFDIVDESSLMLSSTQNVVNPANPYVQASNQAVLTISNNSGSINVPIALVPVTVGTTDPSIMVQAGTPKFQIPSWVNGSSNQTLMWSISPASGAGSIDSTGNYIAPASIATKTQATITLTSVANPSASTSLEVNVVPSGSIYIDSGSSQPTVGANSSSWNSDGGFETGSYAAISDGWPTGAWGSIPNVEQFQTYMYNWGDDMEYRMHVPNGNYVVTFLYGVGECTGTFGGNVFDNGLILGPLHFQTQENLVLQNFDPGVAINHACRTPAYVSLPASVADTTLKVAVRATGGPNAHAIPVINGLEITPFPFSLSFFTIVGAGQQTTVAPGNSLQLTAVNWFGTPNAPLVWSIMSGPGTISQSGVYTAPSSVASNSIVVVKVQAANSNQQGSLALTVPAK